MHWFFFFFQTVVYSCPWYNKKQHKCGFLKTSESAWVWKLISDFSFRVVKHQLHRLLPVEVKYSLGVKNLMPPCMSQVQTFHFKQKTFYMCLWRLRKMFIWHKNMTQVLKSCFVLYIISIIPYLLFFSFSVLITPFKKKIGLQNAVTVKS